MKNWMKKHPRITKGTIGTIAALFIFGLGTSTGTTETVTKTEVKEVPKIKTVTKTKTETKKVPVTPKACVQALDKAKDIFSETGDVMETASQYIPLIQQAAEAGLDVDAQAIENITEKMNTYNGQLENHASKVNKLKDKYLTADEKCRDSK